MAGLEGTLNTPFGTMKKTTALYVGGAAVIIIGIGVYRAKKNEQAAAIAASGANTGINPATGFPYGSAEDAAALANQGGYITPTGGGGGGGGGYPEGVFTNNAQWVQGVVEYMTTNNLVEDPSQLSAALGKYITGSGVTSVQKGLIEQAIAVKGYPPVAGPAGYPPSINMEADAPGSPPGTAPTGSASPVRVVQASADRIILYWNAVSGATRYWIGIRLWGSTYWSSKVGYDHEFESGPTSEWTSGGFKTGQGYDFYVAGENQAGDKGPIAGPATIVMK